MRFSAGDLVFRLTIAGFCLLNCRTADSPVEAANKIAENIKTIILRCTYWLVEWLFIDRFRWRRAGSVQPDPSCVKAFAEAENDGHFQESSRDGKFQREFGAASRAGTDAKAAAGGGGL